jgi:hypothetical protein
MNRCLDICRLDVCDRPARHRGLGLGPCGRHRAQLSFRYRSHVLVAGDLLRCTTKLTFCSTMSDAPPTPPSTRRKTPSRRDDPSVGQNREVMTVLPILMSLGPFHRLSAGGLADLRWR